VKKNYHFHEHELAGETRRYRQECIGQIELRFEPEDDEDLDEVVLWQDGRCLIHLERMHEECIWMGLYDDPYCLHLDFRPGKGVPVEISWQILSRDRSRRPTPRAEKGKAVYGPFTIRTAQGGNHGVLDELSFHHQGERILHIQGKDARTVLMNVWDGKKGVRLTIGPTGRHRIDVAEWKETAGNETERDKWSTRRRESSSGEQNQPNPGRRT
jgi:hypothetical protein